jgi:hypothetical protein
MQIYRYGRIKEDKMKIRKRKEKHIWVDVNRTREPCNTCHHANHTLSILIQLKISLDHLIPFLFYQTSSWRNIYCWCVLYFWKYEIWNMKSWNMIWWYDDMMMGWSHDKMLEEKLEIRKRKRESTFEWKWIEPATSATPATHATHATHAIPPTMATQLITTYQQLPRSKYHWLDWYHFCSIKHLPAGMHIVNACCIFENMKCEIVKYDMMIGW